ncbi:MAG: transposase [Desulfobacteraceae bacterium]|nr:transposase [Desulfobacteraceae bacterium]
MIKAAFEEAHTAEWVEKNIGNPNHDLVILRHIIPWEKITGSLTQFYDKDRGAEGKELRTMVAVTVVSRFHQFSDREAVRQVKENRYVQYFCNVADEELETFLHPSSLCVFRKRIGEKGAAVIEKEVFGMLRRAGAVEGDCALIDPTVPESSIIYPNDVQLIYKAFRKMRSSAGQHGIPLWWDDALLKKMWREFGLSKERDRLKWLAEFAVLFFAALETFGILADSLNTSNKRKSKVLKLLRLPELLKEQTQQKLRGERHIKDRIVSLDDPDARPIKKGKSHPKCEFGTTVQMSFNRQGFMITVENFIGNPNDKTLYPGTLNLFKERMGRLPDTVVTDLGIRSRSNIENTPGEVGNVFMGRSTDVSEEKQDFCRSARSATEGFIAVAKNLRGFRKSLWHRLGGHRMWSLLCQTAYNLKKFLQLYYKEEIKEKSLVKLKLA